MADLLCGIEFGDSGLKLAELPFFRLDVGGDSLGGKKGLRPLGAFGECVQALLCARIESVFSHRMCSPVCIVAQLHTLGFPRDCMRSDPAVRILRRSLAESPMKLRPDDMVLLVICSQSWLKNDYRVGCDKDFHQTNPSLRLTLLATGGCGR